MAADGKNDINQMFGQMLTQWEDMSNQFAQSVMRTPQFGKGQDAALAMSLKLRETMHEQMTRFLDAANMPTKDDLVELRGAVDKLDVRLERIERALADKGNGGPALNSPPRTRKPRPRTGDADG
jgi:polyhydroxyalkanoate synthesis regulator phasin